MRLLRIGALVLAASLYGAPAAAQQPAAPDVPDTVLDGLAAGAVVGAASATSVMLWRGRLASRGTFVTVIAISTGTGALLGALIDASRPRPARGPRRVRFEPTIAPGHRRVTVEIRF